MMPIALRSLFLVSILVVAAPSLGAEITRTVATVEIEDGDTLLIELDGAVERFQLAGIDAPEDTDNAKLQRDLERTGLERDDLLALGLAATDHLRLLVDRGGPFALTYDPDLRDRYGRILAEVSGAGAGSLNVAMLEDGFAIVLPKEGSEGSTNDPRVGLQREAIATRRGLWGEYREAALAWRGKRVD